MKSHTQTASHGVLLLLVGSNPVAVLQSARPMLMCMWAGRDRSVSKVGGVDDGKLQKCGHVRGGRDHH